MSVISPPRPVASTLHWLHPILSGFPVIVQGSHVLVILLCSSSIHAMICPFVFTSGAGTSLRGPNTLENACIYALASLSFSFSDSFLGSTITHHFHHQSGRLTTAVLMLIRIASALTSSSETSWCRLIHHLYGHLTFACWALYAV